MAVNSEDAQFFNFISNFIHQVYYTWDVRLEENKNYVN